VPYFAILFSLLFLACEEPQPLDKDFALAYAELRVAEHEYGETEDGMAARFQILRKHNLDLNVFEEKIEEIKKEDANWAKFQKAVIEVLDSITKEGKEIRENKNVKDIKDLKKSRNSKEQP
jgi:hypothetical protein